MADAHNLLNKQLGDYILEQKLTSGGMAHIYIGRDIKLDRLAAVKILTPDISGSDRTLSERFEREARAIAQLEHDNIVPIYQFGTDDGLYFLAMRYIKGNDLADEIRRLRNNGELLPMPRALYILGQIADALDYAHGRDIIHRDIKPSNVLLGENDKAVLSDFGLVLWQSVDKTMGTAFGTPRYISPEQATDSQKSVPQSDIYSLGVIVYEIATGEHLFTGSTPMEVALAHITDEPKPPRLINDKIPVGAEQEILKALSKEATNRHKTASQFINALKAYYPPYDPRQAPVAVSAPAEAKWDDKAAQSAPDSNASILSGWTMSSTATKAEYPDPLDDAPTPIMGQGDGASSGNRNVIWIAGLVVMFVVIAGLGLLLSNNNSGAGDVTATQGNDDDTSIALNITETDTPALPTETTLAATDTPDQAPSNTPEPPTEAPTLIATTALAAVSTNAGDNASPVPPSLTPTPQIRALRLHYTNNDFALLNAGNTPLDIEIVLDGINNVDGERVTLNADLGIGACIVISNSEANTNLPQDVPCDTPAQRISRSQPLFWFANDGDDTSFTITVDGETVQTCDTVGRAVGRVLQTNTSLDCLIDLDN